MMGGRLISSSPRTCTQSFFKLRFHLIAIPHEPILTAPRIRPPPARDDANATAKANFFIWGSPLLFSFPPIFPKVHSLSSSLSE